MVIRLIILGSRGQNRKNQRFNLGFEQINDSVAINWGYSLSADYKIAFDSVDVHKGKYAASIAFIGGSANFQALYFKLPDNYNGKKITLSGYIKTKDVSDGYAGLWMRIDPSVAFDNMNGRGITGTTDWKKYEIELAMKPGQTKQILVGGLLIGRGKMWLDQLEVKVDGKPVEGLTKYQPVLDKANRDTAFDKGSGIASIDINNKTIENLGMLGMVWFFLNITTQLLQKATIIGIMSSLEYCLIS